VAAVWIFVATRSVANLSKRLRMHASVPKIKNGAHYDPQLMTEQSNRSAGSVAPAASGAEGHGRTYPPASAARKCSSVLRQEVVNAEAIAAVPQVVNGSFTTFNRDTLTAAAMVKRQDQAGSVESVASISIRRVLCPR
jgi:hypothetical protein